MVTVIIVSINKDFLYLFFSFFFFANSSFFASIFSGPYPPTFYPTTPKFYFGKTSFFIESNSRDKLFFYVVVQHRYEFVTLRAYERDWDSCLRIIHRSYHKNEIGRSPCLVIRGNFYFRAQEKTKKWKNAYSHTSKNSHLPQLEGQLPLRKSYIQCRFRNRIVAVKRTIKIIWNVLSVSECQHRSLLPFFSLQGS